MTHAEVLSPAGFVAIRHSDGALVGASFRSRADALVDAGPVRCHVATATADLVELAQDLLEAERVVGYSHVGEVYCTVIEYNEARLAS